MVQPSALQQIGVPALLDDLPLVQDHDAVGVPDGREAVGDDYGRAPPEKLVERPLDQHLRVGVDVGRRLVEQQHPRVRDQCAGEAD